MPAFAWGLRREASVLGAACGSTEKLQYHQQRDVVGTIRADAPRLSAGVTEAGRRYKAVRLGAAS